MSFSNMELYSQWEQWEREREQDDRTEAELTGTPCNCDGCQRCPGHAIGCPCDVDKPGKA